MKEFKQTKKRYNILNIILIVLICISFVAIISLEVIFEMEMSDAVAIGLSIIVIVLIWSVILLFVIFKSQNKISKKIIENLNKELNLEYSYQAGEPILDIVDASLHPYEKNMQVVSKDGIIGKYEDIEFEYYLCTFHESMFIKDTIVDLYVFKNVSVFSKSFFVTAKKLKNVEQYKITSTEGEAKAYTTKNDEVILDDLPKDVLFFKEIEKIKNTYEKTKNWIK